jgi:predicted nucleic acid-binding Zn ribbon protein
MLGMQIGSRWRALPGPAPDPTRVAEVLDRTLRSLGAPTSVSGVEVIFERWAELVGENMAARTRPVHIDGDTLVVGCDEPAVATHVRFLQAELLTRLTELSGERRIERIEVRVDQARRRGPRPPRTRFARR